MQTNLAYAEPPCMEMIGGKVIMMASPSSNHNRVTRNLSYLFENYLQNRKCEYFPDREALYLENNREEYQPDGMVVCDPEKVFPDGVHGAPDLVIEVLSPGSFRYDRGHKYSVYEQHGVREYWIVDPANRTIEQYLLTDGHFVLHNAAAQLPDYALRRMREEEKARVQTEFSCGLFDDLTIRVEDVFRRVDS